MAETISTTLALVLLFIGLPVLILRFIDRRRTVRRERRYPPSEQVAEREAYERRILTPDWTCVEGRLGRAWPPALFDLYADRRLITQRDLGYGDEMLVSTFVPLDHTDAHDTQAASFANMS